MNNDDSVFNSTSPSLIERLRDARHPCYIVAEMSANHLQDRKVARDLIYAMKEAGADAVKLQTYTPDSMTIDSDQAAFRIGSGTVWEGRQLYALYREAMTPWEWHAELFELARSLQMDCFSSPFDRAAVDFLEQFNPVAYKIASFELVDLPLINYVASQGRPVILSTGMATVDEIAEAVAAVKSHHVPLALLKCTSAYPAPVSSMNLLGMAQIKDRFQAPVGLSDHSLHPEVAVAAVALGARVIEKHFTLDRRNGGADSSFSLEPLEFRALVESVRVVEAALGQPHLDCDETERVCKAFRRSLYAIQPIGAGERFTEQNVRSIRPAGGLAPKYLDEILQRRAACDIQRGTPIVWELVEGC
jgi:pseudaminic acid synthase